MNKSTKQEINQLITEIQNDLDTVKQDITDSNYRETEYSKHRIEYAIKLLRDFHNNTLVEVSNIFTYLIIEDGKAPFLDKMKGKHNER